MVVRAGGRDSGYGGIRLGDRDRSPSARFRFFSPGNLIGKLATAESARFMAGMGFAHLTRSQLTNGTVGQP
jgi:hypothetical protein